MHILKRALLTLLCVFLLYTQGSAQTNSEIARKKGGRAIALMDSGKVDEALLLLKECRALDPESIVYPYETAYAYHLKKDYRQSISILEGILDHKDCFGRVYQLMGNSYDLSGDATKAVQTYEAGIKRFPGSGELYLERGNMDLMRKDFFKALAFYEEGIERDPKFPSNYYWAAKIFCHTSEEVWGMMYGEIFMNLERNTSRTEELSKLLYDTYKTEIKLKSDSGYSVSFSEIGSRNGAADSVKLKPLFGTEVYEPALLSAISGETVVDINSLSEIRRRFLDNYYRAAKKLVPNVLFDYQKRIVAAGHFDAYNHWVLMKGDPVLFNEWLSANQKEWDNFVDWFEQNPFSVDITRSFSRRRY